MEIWIITGIIYSLIAIVHIFYFLTLDKLSGNPAGIMISVIMAIFWPIPWLWYIWDRLRGRVT